MAARRLNFALARGESFGAVGFPFPRLDLTGVHAHMTVVDGAGTQVADLTDANDGLVIDTDQRVIYPAVAAAATVAWPVGTLQYDLFLLYADGTTRVQEYAGTVVVRAAVTGYP